MDRISILKIKKTRGGQAVLEYLIVFSFISLIGIKLVQSFHGFMANTVGGLGHVLTVKLTSGVCLQNCFYAGYKNGIQ